MTSLVQNLISKILTKIQGTEMLTDLEIMYKIIIDFFLYQDLITDLGTRYSRSCVCIFIFLEASVYPVRETVTSLESRYREVKFDAEFKYDLRSFPECLDRQKLTVGQRESRSDLTIDSILKMRALKYLRIQ